MKNPYREVSDHQLWSRAVGRVEAHDINPIVKPKFQISFKDRVATAGSCFAQHISRQIKKIGFNYFCPENNLKLNKEKALKQHFGVFQPDTVTFTLFNNLINFSMRL